ncbi:MAG: hypothetical protein ACRCV7_00015 [Culicoidibacterales bacterium]
MARQNKESFDINLFGCLILVKCYIEKPSFGTYECPADNGSIEITDMWYSGVDISPIIEQIPNYEELIINEIRKQL